MNRLTNSSTFSATYRVMNLCAAIAGGCADLETITHLRPSLDRYSARMTGSVLDEEDIVYCEAVVGIGALPSTTNV